MRGLPQHAMALVVAASVTAAWGCAPRALDDRQLLRRMERLEARIAGRDQAQVEASVRALGRSLRAGRRDTRVLRYRPSNRHVLRALAAPGALSFSRVRREPPGR